MRIQGAKAVQWKGVASAPPRCPAPPPHQNSAHTPATTMSSSKMAPNPPGSKAE